MTVLDRDSVRGKLYSIIFEHDTLAGRLFDVILLVIIIASVVIVILESIADLRHHYERFFAYSEWVFTFLFTVEYILRLVCSPDRKKYAFSFFGLIDALSVLPTYLDILFGGAHYMMIVRVLRLLRIFRIFKLSRYLSEAEILKKALLQSRAKITVFLVAVLTTVIIIGAVMYLIEGPEHGFTDIPKSIYWAIVTLTTVGYGDIAPETQLGQLLACCVMFLGYGIIAVPTGIAAVELREASKRTASHVICFHCNKTGHESDAQYCKFCGRSLFA